jgi:hypothetical protein
MVDNKQLELVTLYQALMEEIKIRISAIDSGTSGKLHLPAQITREFCFLQLRLICELIALGCLVAHGDLEKATRLRNDWAADKIMGELEKLHADFFPISVVQEPGYTGKSPHNFKGVSQPPLTKNDLVSLYRECGDYLHKGSLKNLLKGNSPKQVNFPEITKRAQRFVDLLNIHVIGMLGFDKVLICMMQTVENNRNVQVTMAEKRDYPPQPKSDRPA